MVLQSWKSVSLFTDGEWLEMALFQCSDKKNTNLILFILYVFYGKLFIFQFDS